MLDDDTLVEGLSSLRNVHPDRVMSHAEAISAAQRNAGSQQRPHAQRDRRLAVAAAAGFALLLSLGTAFVGGLGTRSAIPGATPSSDDVPVYGVVLAGGSALRVFYETRAAGTCGPSLQLRAVEEPDRVVLHLQRNAPGPSTSDGVGVCDLPALSDDTTVHLQSGVGQRAVVDAATGRRLLVWGQKDAPIPTQLPSSFQMLDATDGSDASVTYADTNGDHLILRRANVRAEPDPAAMTDGNAKLSNGDEVTFYSVRSDEGMETSLEAVWQHESTAFFSLTYSRSSVGAVALTKDDLRDIADSLAQTS